jgi:hypothetical protein
MKNFQYGEYVIEYRTENNGELKFLKKRINDLDIAMKECARLRDMGYADVTIVKYNGLFK